LSGVGREWGFEEKFGKKVRRGWRLRIRRLWQWILRYEVGALSGGFNGRWDMGNGHRTQNEGNAKHR